MSNTLSSLNIFRIKKSHIGDAITGMATILGLNAIVFSAFLALNTVWPVFMNMIFSIGLIQAVYLIPLMIWSIKRRVKGFTKGLVLGAMFTMAVNLGCFLITLRYMSAVGN
jgi:hypothetical protein